MSKIIAIAGAALILICFFLPWESTSFMGTNIKYSGFQKAAGIPPDDLKLNINPSEYGLGSDLGFVYGILEEVLGGGMSGEEMAVLSEIVEAVNRAFARPILFLFPVAAVLVVVFSILSNRKPHISYGIAMIALTLVLGILLTIQGIGTSTIIRFTKLAESIMSLFNVQFLAPSSRFGIGFFGTAVGLIAFSAAGFLGWQDYSKAVKSPDRLAFQSTPGYGYPDQSGQRGQFATPPQVRTSGAGPAPQGQSAFLYQQNHLQYKNYQQHDAPAQQSAPYNNPVSYPNVQQPGYQTPVVNQPPTPYQNQPQQPLPPQTNDPNNLVTGWRAIRPPEDPRQ